MSLVYLAAVSTAVEAACPGIRDTAKHVGGAASISDENQVKVGVPDAVDGKVACLR